MADWHHTITHGMFKSDADHSRTRICNCIGPQNGEPLCPCQMQGVKIVNGRYVLPARDLGPVPLPDQTGEKQA